MTLEQQLDKLQLSIDGAIGLIRRYDEAAKRVIEQFYAEDFSLLPSTYQAILKLNRVYRREGTTNDSKQ